MANLVKPGPTSLNMHDIAENLEVVHRHVSKVKQTGPKSTSDSTIVEWREDGSIEKPVKKDYRKYIVKADDTDLVAGIPAACIAISNAMDAVTAKDNGLSEEEYQNRSTVHNARYLDGKSLDFFQTKQEGAQLDKKTQSIDKNYGDDIASIRDELYQLKHNLEKNGLITLTNEHFGYNDIFRNGYQPYEWEELGLPTANSTDPSELHVDLDTS